MLLVASKIKKEISTEELLIEMLIEKLIREAKLNNGTKASDDNTTLDDFIDLLYTDIINKSKSDLNTELWIAFGKWLGFKKPTRRVVRNHIKNV